MPVSEYSRQLRSSTGQFAGGFGIEWVGLDLLEGKFVKYGTDMEAYRIKTADALAQAMESYAKQNAPWDDRSGDARAGLHAEAVHEPDLSTVYLGYAADTFYGYYLEHYTYSGVSYAIVGPTIEYFGRLMWDVAGGVR